MLITRFFRKLSILKQADIFLPFKTDKTVEYLKQPLAYDIMPVGKMTEMLIERMKLPEVAASGSFYSILGRRLIP